MLKKVSVDIKPREKIGVVSRTGARKSLLALTLLRGLEVEEGTNTIDYVAIYSINLDQLRQIVTIVLQDSTLFTDTLRFDLDPFKLFTDADLFQAMRDVQSVDQRARRAPTSSKCIWQLMRATMETRTRWKIYHLN